MIIYAGFTDSFNVRSNYLKKFLYKILGWFLNKIVLKTFQNGRKKIRFLILFFFFFYILRTRTNFFNLHKIYKEGGSFRTIVQVCYCWKNSVCWKRETGERKRYVILSWKLYLTPTFATFNNNQKMDCKHL